MSRTSIVLVFAAAVAASCGSGPGTDQFVESFQEARTDISDADARCVVENLQRTYSDEDLASLIEESTDSTAEQQRFADRQLAAVRACDLQDQVSAELVSAFARANDVTPNVAECAVGSLQDRFGFWELTDLLGSDELELRFQRRQFEAIFSCGDRTAVVDQLGPQMVEQGVPEASASCVASAVAEAMEIADLAVLYSGEMTDRFYSLYFAGLEDCDVVPPD
jgi:hypothetical protein